MTNCYVPVSLIQGVSDRFAKPISVDGPGRVRMRHRCKRCSSTFAAREALRAHARSKHPLNYYLPRLGIAAVLGLVFVLGGYAVLTREPPAQEVGAPITHVRGREEEEDGAGQHSHHTQQIHGFFAIKSSPSEKYKRWDSNPRTPTGQGPQPCAFDQAWHKVAPVGQAKRLAPRKTAKRYAKNMNR